MDPGANHRRAEDATTRLERKVSEVMSTPCRHGQALSRVRIANGRPQVRSRRRDGPLRSHTWSVGPGRDEAERLAPTVHLEGIALATVARVLSWRDYPVHGQPSCPRRPPASAESPHAGTPYRSSSMSTAGDAPRGDPVHARYCVKCQRCNRIFGPVGEWPTGCPPRGCPAVLNEPCEGTADSFVTVPCPSANAGRGR
jgi:hypothetical protein